MGNVLSAFTFKGLVPVQKHDSTHHVPSLLKTLFYWRASADSKAVHQNHGGHWDEEASSIAMSWTVFFISIFNAGSHFIFLLST